MKENKAVLITACISFIISFCIAYVWLSKQSPISKNISNPTEKTYSIAILVPVTHPAIEEIRQGFVDTISKSASCSFDDYNANGNRTLLRSLSEIIVEKKYDLIFTIATIPAIIMEEVTRQRNCLTPIVAGAVDNPVDLKLVASMKSSGNNVTSVTSIDSFEEQIVLLKQLKPSFKGLLLVYNPTSGLDQKKHDVAKICEKHMISFKAMEIYTINDLTQKVASIAQSYDTIFILKDNFVVSAIESLITLCNRTHKTLYASDLNSGDKGAALSYGVKEYDDGVVSAQSALQILIHGKKPSDVPSVVSDNFKIKINTKTMKQQDIPLSDLTITLMRSGEVV